MDRVQEQSLVKKKAQESLTKLVSEIKFSLGTTARDHCLGITAWCGYFAYINRM